MEEGLPRSVGEGLDCGMETDSEGRGVGEEGVEVGLDGEEEGIR